MRQISYLPRTCLSLSLRTNLKILWQALDAERDVPDAHLPWVVTEGMDDNGTTFSSDLAVNRRADRNRWMLDNLERIRFKLFGNIGDGVAWCADLDDCPKFIFFAAINVGPNASCER